jgi:hypothetical protein
LKKLAKKDIEESTQMGIGDFVSEEGWRGVELEKESVLQLERVHSIRSTSEGIEFCGARRAARRKEWQYPIWGNDRVSGCVKLASY